MPDPDPATSTGVDVVDRLHPRCLRLEGDPRFLDRILSEEERAGLEAAADPDLRLWLLWAGKEAAFKAVSGALPPVFRHREFVVRVEGEGDVPCPGAAGGRGEGGLAGHCLWMDRRIPLLWDPGRERVLAVAVPESPPPPSARVGVSALGEESRTEGDRAGRRRRASTAVREAAALDVARVLGVDPSRVGVTSEEGPPGRSPPVALLDGERAPAHVSLSHHGRWIAWSVLPVAHASGRLGP